MKPSQLVVGTWQVKADQYRIWRSKSYLSSCKCQYLEVDVEMDRNRWSMRLHFVIEQPQRMDNPGIGEMEYPKCRSGRHSCPCKLRTAASRYYHIAPCKSSLYDLRLEGSKLNLPTALPPPTITSIIEEQLCFKFTTKKLCIFPKPP